MDKRISSHEYFFGRNTNSEKDAKPYIVSKGGKGKVIFALPEINDPKLGTISVQGEYPRIPSKFKRFVITPEEFETLKTELRAWTALFFDSKAIQFFQEELLDSACYFMGFINPVHDISSLQMDYAIKFVYWWFILDDVLEFAVEEGVPFKTMEAGLSQLSKVILHGDQGVLPVEGFPGLHCFYDSLADLHQRFMAHIPGYKQNRENLCHLIERYTDAMRFMSITKLDSRFSEDMYHCFKKNLSFAEGIVEIIMLLDSRSLPKEIRESFSMRCLFDMYASTCVLVNDVLGFNKEFEHGQTDNLLIFKLVQKKKPVDLALTEIMRSLNESISDYLVLRDTILVEFDNHPDLVRCIEVMEGNMDGHDRFYLYSMRHRTIGKVSVTED